jgi:two-component system, NarL family, response regulator DesR
MNEPTRIVLVEDNEVLREALMALLESEPDLHPVAHTDELAAVAGLCREHRAHTAVLDMEVNGESSVKWLPQLCAEMPDVRFIIFSGHGHTDLIRRTMAAGAAAYVVKSGNPVQLLSAIRNVRQDASPAPSE